MSNGRTLTDQESLLVVTAIRDLLPKYDNHQGKLGGALQITQGHVSALLAGKQKAGLGLAKRVAFLLGIHEDRLLGRYGEDPYPNRAAVIDLLRHELDPSVVHIFTREAPENQEDKMMWEWALAIASAQASALRRHANTSSKSSNTNLHAQRPVKHKR